jgi:hypothetical protein
MAKILHLCFGFANKKMGQRQPQSGAFQTMHQALAGSPAEAALDSEAALREQPKKSH